MRLNELIASSTATLIKPIEMTGVAKQPEAKSGSHNLIAEFFTADRVIRAELTTSEARLSDHLNSSTSEAEVKPFFAAHGGDGTQVDLVGTLGRITKDKILFAVPLNEPGRVAGLGEAWKPTVKRECWVGIGPFKIAGTIHTDAGYDTRSALRLLDKQFVAITEAEVTLHNGQVEKYSAVLVNRAHVDLLSLKESW